MTVVAPGDPTEVKSLIPQLFELNGPSYIRIGKFGEPVYSSESPIILGKARCIAEGRRVAVISVGEMTPVVLKAVSNLNANGVFPYVCHFHTLKPADTTILDNLLPLVSS